jgi:hypothetical protein
MIPQPSPADSASRFKQSPGDATPATPFFRKSHSSDMKTKATQFCAIVASMAFLDAGYGNPASLEFPRPDEPQPTTENAPILLAQNVVLQRIVQTQTTLIQHEATERQRKIAQQHAVAYIKHLEPQKKVAMKKKKVRYIAVDTEKNEKTSPKAKKVVMVWDTQSESLVGNTVYDLPDPPAVGGNIVFNTYAAEYVGGSN